MTPSVLVTVPITVIKYFDKSNSRKGGFILAQSTRVSLLAEEEEEGGNFACVCGSPRGGNLWARAEFIYSQGTGTVATLFDFFSFIPKLSHGSAISQLDQASLPWLTYNG